MSEMELQGIIQSVIILLQSTTGNNMTTYQIILSTPPTKICRYAGEIRTIEFTGTREDLFTYVRWKSRTYERLTEIRVKQGNEWVREDLL